MQIISLGHLKFFVYCFKDFSPSTLYVSQLDMRETGTVLSCKRFFSFYIQQQQLDYIIYLLFLHCLQLNRITIE